MTDPAATAALRDATGKTPRAPDAAILRELRGLAVGPVSVVYRSFLPDGTEYGVGSEDILTDDHGRPIRLAEGFTLRQPESGARKLGITQADLDRAHAEVINAYRAVWSQGAAFARHISTSFPVAAAGKQPGPAIGLRGSEPWIADMGEAQPTPDLAPAGPSANVVSQPRLDTAAKAMPPEDPRSSQKKRQNYTNRL